MGLSSLEGLNADWTASESGGGNPSFTSSKRLHIPFTACHSAKDYLSSLTGYLDIDRSKFTCSIEGQAIIWRSSLLNSSFSKAWSFWNICWMLFLTGLNKMNSVSLLDKYSDMLRNVDCSFVFIVL